MVLGAAIVGVLGLALNALFTVAGLQFGWWSAPVFAPLFGWLLACPVCNRVLRPVELDGLSWRQRLKGAGMLVVVLWLAWPLWAGPTAAAWKAAHGGAGPWGLSYPLGVILAASPVAMGAVAFLLLALGMVLAPRIRPREAKHTPSPGDPEPLRPALLDQRPAARVDQRQADRPRWPDPTRWP
jgi:hypothetical protein